MALLALEGAYAHTRLFSALNLALENQKTQTDPLPHFGDRCIIYDYTDTIASPIEIRVTHRLQILAIA
jgi:hypothetical protein